MGSVPLKHNMVNLPKNYPIITLRKLFSISSWSYPSPGGAPFLSDNFNMLVPPSRAGGGKHSSLMRWNDHLRIGMLRQHCLRYRRAVAGAIAHECFKRCRDLTEQIWHGRLSKFYVNGPYMKQGWAGLQFVQHGRFPRTGAGRGSGGQDE